MHCEMLHQNHSEWWGSCCQPHSFLHLELWRKAYIDHTIQIIQFKILWKDQDDQLVTIYHVKDWRLKVKINTNLIFLRKDCSVSNCCRDNSSTAWGNCSSCFKSEAVRSLEKVVTCKYHLKSAKMCIDEFIL